MRHDHIGIPKFIEKGFSIEEKTYVYDLIRKKQYQMTIDRLGTKNNYYDLDVEEQILASDVESEFCNFYNDFCNADDCNYMKSLLNLNKNLIEKFFSFMYLRSKKTLDLYNDESLASKIFGDISHSELLRIQTIIRVNPLKIIGDNYNMYPLINFSNLPFINNSIGFGMMINKNYEKSIIIPLTSKKAILITNNEELVNIDFLYIEPDSIEKTEFINKKISLFEKIFGNGFIFGINQESIEKCKNYIEFGDN